MARDYYDRKRNTWDRGRDEVRSWFGDEEAERRRMHDARESDWDGSGSGYRNPYREDRNDHRGPGFREDLADMEYDRDWDMDNRYGDHFEGYRSRSQQGGGMNRGGWHERDERSMYGGSQAGRWGGQEGMPQRRHSSGGQYSGGQYSGGQYYSGGQHSGGHTDYTGHGPSGYRRSDERITEEVNDALTWDWRVDATDISVEVQDGIVTLSGHVRDRRMKRRAEDVAENIRGVDDVQNQLRVGSSGGSRDSSGSDSGFQSSGQTARQSGSSTVTGYEPGDDD